MKENLGNLQRMTDDKVEKPKVNKSEEHKLEFDCKIFINKCVTS